MNHSYPAGTYRVETDEEQLENLSFVAYRRVATRIHLTKPGIVEVLSVDPGHLAEALDRDKSYGMDPLMGEPAGSKE